MERATTEEQSPSLQNNPEVQNVEELNQHSEIAQAKVNDGNDAEKELQLSSDPILTGTDTDEVDTAEVDTAEVGTAEVDTAALKAEHTIIPMGEASESDAMVVPGVNQPEEISQPVKAQPMEAESSQTPQIENDNVEGSVPPNLVKKSAGLEEVKQECKTEFENQKDAEMEIEDQKEAEVSVSENTQKNPEQFSKDLKAEITESESEKVTNTIAENLDNDNSLTKEQEDEIIVEVSPSTINDTAKIEDQKEARSKDIDSVMDGQEEKDTEAAAYSSDEIDINSVDLLSGNDNDGDDDSSESSSSGSDSDDEDSYIESEEESNGITDMNDVADYDEDDNFDGPIQSKNEVPEEAAPALPEDYKIDEKTPIDLIGEIYTFAENNLIIKGISSAEYRVLKENSILCLGDRKPIGLIFEIFGPLKSPFYRVKFNNTSAEDCEFYKSSKGTKVYYVVTSAEFELTEKIRALKGCDASNGNDEELPENELDFSDDAAEAEFKKSKKKKRKRKQDNSKAGTSNDDTAAVAAKRKAVSSTHVSQYVPLSQKPHAKPYLSMVAGQTSNSQSDQSDPAPTTSGALPNLGLPPIPLFSNQRSQNHDKNNGNVNNNSAYSNNSNQNGQNFDAFQSLITHGAKKANSNNNSNGGYNNNYNNNNHRQSNHKTGYIPNNRFNNSNDNDQYSQPFVNQNQPYGRSAHSYGGGNYNNNSSANTQFPYSNNAGYQSNANSYGQYQSNAYGAQQRFANSQQAPQPVSNNSNNNLLTQVQLINALASNPQIAQVVQLALQNNQLQNNNINTDQLNNYNNNNYNSNNYNNNNNNSNGYSNGAYNSAYRGGQYNNNYNNQRDEEYDPNAPVAKNNLSGYGNNNNNNNNYNGYNQ